jgi:hypothetical protein
MSSENDEKCKVRKNFTFAPKIVKALEKASKESGIPENAIVALAILDSYEAMKNMGLFKADF